MGRSTLLLAWGVSLLPLLVELQTGEPVLPGASRVGLTLLPWLALVGLPTGSRPGPRHQSAPELTGFRWSEALVPIAFLLPGLGVALGLDAHGASGLRVPSQAILGLFVILAWSVAREGARWRGGGRRRLFAALWLVFVPGLVALWTALAWAPGPPGLGGDGASSSSPWVVFCSPLSWVLDWTRAGEPATDPVFSGAFVLGTACVVLVFVVLGSSAFEKPTEELS